MIGIDGELLVAVCSAVGTAAGTFGGIRLMSYRIEQLEKQVERLSEVIDRTYRLEQRAELAEERLNSAVKRLERLERRLGNEQQTERLSEHTPRSPHETDTG